MQATSLPGHRLGYVHERNPLDRLRWRYRWKLERQEIRLLLGHLEAGNTALQAVVRDRGWTSVRVEYRGMSRALLTLLVPPGGRD